MACLCTARVTDAVIKCQRKGENEQKDGASPIDAGRFYLRYISATGSFPISGIWRTRRETAFNWTSPKVAYTIGLILFTILHGYNRIAGELFNKVHSCCNSTQ